MNRSNPKSPTLTYRIRKSLYLNLTSACTAECFFCPRKTDPKVKGYDLALWKDPDPEEVIRDIGDPEGYDEIVFCGFGEPLVRLDEVIAIARWLKDRKCRVRINTNGHGNLIHGRNVVPDLAGLIDEVSVSLNASDEEEYLRVVKPKFGKGTFQEVIRFIEECRELLPKVSVTAVAYPGFDAGRFKKLARGLGVPFRIRPYNILG